MMRRGVLAASRRRVAAGPSNVITNGGFADSTGWYGAGFSGKTISGGKANFVASPTFDGFAQAVPLTAGKYYELTWTISGRTSGTVRPSLTAGTQRDGTGRSTNGTFTERLLANTGNTTFEFMLSTAGTLSVDDISLVGPYNTATVGGA